MSTKSTRTKVAGSRHHNASAGTFYSKRTVPETADRAPDNRGDGDDALTCPGCDTPLMTGIRKG